MLLEHIYVLNYEPNKDNAQLNQSINDTWKIIVRVFEWEEQDYHYNKLH